MNKQRLEALSDGVFAIVLTLLIIEIKVPETSEIIKYKDLTGAILHLSPLFWSYFLSFALLTGIWVTHNFLYTIMAKNINRNLIYLNMIFLSFVSLLPFSSHLLGSYPGEQVAVVFYSLNVLILGLIVFFIRSYIINSDQIENLEFGKPDKEHGNKYNRMDTIYGRVRMGISIGVPILAIILSYWSTRISVYVLVFQVVVNIIPGILGFVLRLLGFEGKINKEVVK